MAITQHPLKGKSTLEYVKAMAKIHGQDVLPDVRLPRKLRADKGRHREPYNRQEDKDRPIIMEKLRKDGWTLFRVEPYGRIGKQGFGLGDLWGVHLGMKTGGWIEVKSRTGTLADDQKKRIEEHKTCEIKHWVARLHDFGGYTMELWPEK